jgi:preprotein translocase subunit SecY
MQGKPNNLLYIFTGNIGRKIWTTLSLILIYRLLLNIPIPGFTSLSSTGQQTGNGAFTLVEFVDMLSGGGLLKTSVLGLGLLPYKIAGLLLELLIPLIPALQRRLEEDPRDGRNWLERWKYYLAFPVGIIEALFFIGLVDMSCNGQKFITLGANLDVNSKVSIVSILVAGSFFTVWISSLISEFGIRGQGMSIIILSGIIGRFPSQIAELLAKPNVSKNIAIYIVAFVISIITIVFIQSARRNIPVTYPGRRMGNRMSMPVKGVLPLMVCVGGVDGFVGSQLLVALATFYAPLATCTSVQWINALAHSTIALFSEKSILFGPLAFFSVFIFTLFYSDVIFSQQNYGDNLKRAGAVIPDVRSGAATQKYLSRVNWQLSIAGGLIMGLVAIIPWISNLIAGTTLSLLDGEKTVIMVGTIRDTYLGIDAEMKLQGYQDSLLIR